MQRKKIEEAMFWAQGVCLACETVVEQDDVGEVCPSCGADDVHSAQFILRCADLIEPDDVPF